MKNLQLQKRILLSFSPTLTRMFNHNASTASSSFFSPQLDSYFEPNPRDHVYSCNRAIESLMKSGSIDSALKLFDEMSTRDVITWNILISGHKRYGFSRNALYLYSQMVSQGFIENSSTFSTVLGMFSDEELCQESLQVHSRVIVLGLSLNVYVGSALVDLYMNMGLVDFALRLFNDLPDRNVATWNQLLRGFGEFGRSQKLQLYFRMKKEGVVPNPVTICYLIRAFGSERFHDQGKELHCYAIKVGWAESDVFVSNALVDFYSACGNLTHARKQFQVIPFEDVISWNSLVSVYAYNGHTSKAVDIFSIMQVQKKKPSIRSFVSLLNSSSQNKNLLIGKQVHCFVSKLGFDNSSSYIQSALIDMYGKCGEIKSSVVIYEDIPRRTLEIYNSLMTSFARNNITEDVIELFGLMVDEAIGFDEVSLSTTINASSNLISCKLLHNCAVKSGFERDLAVSCSLINSYSRFGDIKSSCKVFKHVSSPNVICFTSIISAHSRNKMGIECVKLLEEMINVGLKPDKVTFLCVLTACNHSGMVQNGKMVFDSMKIPHGVDPDKRHFACMVDLLGRTGFLEEAEGYVKNEKVGGDSVILGSLFHHCWVHRNEVVGRRIAEIVIKMEPENPLAWLQVSNFYSEIGEFETSKQIREVALARKIQRDMSYYNNAVAHRF